VQRGIGILFAAPNATRCAWRLAALSDVLGRGSSHRNRNNAGELHWIYSEGYQTNYPNTGSGFAVQSLITTAAGTATIYPDGTATFTPANASDATCQWTFMGSLGKVSGSSLATELHISYPPAPGSNLGNIVADKNQVVKSNDAN
jgi:hypothetical protein